ncbi:MAG: hypothetical protein IPM38_15565 [Ignavibacteria bacterium]|nr:hypothetical protein [Ignavibacteria bacterium]
MRSSKLVNILKTFTKEDIKEFEKFVASPYFSRGRNLSPFFNVIKKFYPDFDSNQYSSEKIFCELFPDKKFNTNSVNIIKTLSHELIKLCEEFIIQSGFRSDLNSKNYYLLDNLRKRKLFNEFEKKYKEAEINFKNDHDGSIRNFLDQYYLLDLYNEYCIMTRKYKSSFETTAEMDEISVLVGLIRSYRGFLNKMISVKGYNLEPVSNFSENVIRNLDSQKLLAEMKDSGSKYLPFVAVNHMLYMMNEYPEVTDYYFHLKKLIYDNIKLFGHEPKYILFCSLASYCASMTEVPGNEKFTKEQFEIYDKILSLGLHKWSDKDDFSIHLFRNIVLSAVSMNKTDWLENFINKFVKELAPEDRENMKHYSSAILNYERKKYESALNDIMKITFNFVHYKLDIKNLMFKIYFDMNLYNEALSVLETLRQYLKEAKERSVSNKNRNKNFVKFARELIKLKTSPDKIHPEYFYNKILNEDLLFSKSWLLERADSLLKKQ